MALLTRIAKFALLVTVTAAEKRAEISGSIDQTSTVGIDSRTVKSRFQTIPFTNQDHLDENQRAGSNSTRTVHPPVGLPRLPFTPTTPSNQPTSYPSSSSEETIYYSSRGNSSDADNHNIDAERYNSTNSASSLPEITPLLSMPPPLYDRKIFAHDGVMFEHFGRKIFTDPINNLIAISTLLDGISGRVLLYKPSKKEIVYDANSTISAGYELETEFSSPGELLDGFATAIGLYNNSLLIGAPNSNTVYAYAPDDVTGKFRLYQTITPEDKLHHSKFGCSISINNDNAIIGASEDSTVGFRSGAAYLYSRGSDGNWNFATKLVPTAHSTYYEFGRVVSISSRTAAVSALLSSSGVVHIYRQIDVSATVIKLLPSPIPIIPVAGISKPPIPQAVSTDEDEAVGADENEVVEPETNLESDTEETIAPSSAPLERIWKLESTLVPLESAPQSRFGHALHLTGNFSLISSFAEDGSGQVNVYERFPLPEQGDSARWINTVKLSASSQSRPGDQFGYSISSRDSDRLILIGAPQSEFMEEGNGGQVYLFAPIEPALGKTFGTITRFNTTKSAGPATKILDTFHNIFDTWGLVATVSINSGRIKEGTESRITPVGTKNRNTRRRLESASEYDSELYEMGSGSINSLSYGSSVAFLNDVILIGDELGYGKTNYTGVVHIDNNIYKYLSHHIDTFAEAVGDGASEAPKKQKTNELLSTSKVGIMLLIAIPMISLAVFFLFCANYNKVMCEIDRNNIRKPMMGKEVQDGTIASEMKDIINFHNEEDCEGGSIRNELDHRSQFMMTLPTQLSNFLQGKSYRRGYQNDDHEVTNFAR